MPPDSIAPPQFPPTRWSVVLSASGEGQVSRAALEELCRLYWFPLYSFARQRGCPPEDAEDETQEFLARVAGGGLLTAATPERGRLRTFLLAAFQRDLIDAHRRAGRVKRGGHAEIVSLDALHAEDRFHETLPLDSPAATFDRAWALSTLDAALRILESEYAARGRTALFQALRPFLDPTDESECDYGTAEKATGLERNALRQAVLRLRQRFRALLRQAIADTLEHPTGPLIEEELAALRAALAA